MILNLVCVMSREKTHIAQCNSASAILLNVLHWRYTVEARLSFLFSPLTFSAGEHWDGTFAESKTRHTILPFFN